MWYFPSLNRLSRWQYDVRVQRIGIKDGGVYGLSSISSNTIINNIKKSHWIEILSSIEAYLPLQSNIVSLGILSPLLILRNLFFGKHLFISPTCNEKDIQPSTSCLILSQLESYLFFFNRINLVIIETDYIVENQINLQEVWNWLFKNEVQNILIIGECIEAPTHFTLSSLNLRYCFEGEICSNELTEQIYNFTVVEDICFETKGNGAILYQNTKLLSSNWNLNKYGFVKRIADNIISRRIIDLGQKNFYSDEEFN